MRITLFFFIIMLSHIALQTSAQYKKSENKKIFGTNNGDINENVYELKIESDYTNHQTILFLYTDEVKTDSIKINNLDFVLDSIINYKNIFWHYFFSKCNSCQTSLEIKYQIVLTPKNKKLHIALIDTYRHSLQRNPLDSDFISKRSNYSDTTTVFDKIKNQYKDFRQLALDSNFFEKNYLVEETNYSWLSGDSLKELGLKKKYILKFDKSKKIFYTQKQLMNVTCKFLLENGRIITKHLHNEEVFFLKFYENCSAYYRGKWYLYSNKPFSRHLFSEGVIYDICPLGCW